MKRFLAAIIVVSFCVQSLSAQGFRERYESFKRQSISEYSSFREACNNRYINFLLDAWQLCEAQDALEQPKEEWRPPVKMEEDKRVPLREKKVPSETVVVSPEDTVEPRPLVLIDEKKDAAETFSFYYFHSPMTVRIREDSRIKIPSLDEKGVAETWKLLCGKEYDSLIADCLEIRQELHLCDWAYLLLLLSFASEYQSEKNEAILLTAYLFSQSGYQMRLGISDKELSLLFACKQILYGRPYYSLDGMNYWVLNGDARSMRVVAHDFPEGRPLSLSMNHEPLLAWRPSENKLLNDHVSIVAAPCRVNLNLLEYFELYPAAQFDENPLTRWAMYANTPIDPVVQAQLYPVLERAMFGRSIPEAANLLLRFVQTAFSYEYDDKVWGYDRALFAEETLFYPYADCEDRAILFSRLVRDLLDLEVALVYYPGHLATAVRFPMPLAGDYLELDTERYLVCDPTYIGAPIGVSMPDMSTQTAKAILLK